MPAPAAGILSKILAQPDQTVQVGEVLGEIETNGDGGPAAGESAPPVPPEADDDAESVEVTFPEMGDSVAEGTVLEWRVEAGDTVAVDDILVEISTDKVDAEVPAPVAGTVQEILVEPDQTVQVGAVLCRIAAGADAPAGQVQPEAKPVEETAGEEPRLRPRTAAGPHPWRPASPEPTASTWRTWRARALAAGSPRTTCSPRSRATAHPRPRRPPAKTERPSPSAALRRRSCAS